MSNELAARLSVDSTEAQKIWLVTQLVLSLRPQNVQDAALTAATPHWFNAEILAALLPASRGEVAELHEYLSELSFVEPFGALGHAFHDLTRRAILSQLLEHNISLIQDSARRAYEYFRVFDDSQNSVEANYHLLLIDKAAGLERFKRNMRFYRLEGVKKLANVHIQLLLRM
jgi:DNA-binding transcriptional ArsR family regulator